MNIGAAGTLVVEKPGSRAKLRAELLRRLPFETEMIFCDGRQLVRLEDDSPFGNRPPAPDVVRFVSILPKPDCCTIAIPLNLPADGPWFVRLIAAKGQFVFGVYRRHMKTIGYLGQIDKLFGANVTARNWNTMRAVVRVLQAQ